MERFYHIRATEYDDYDSRTMDNGGATILIRSMTNDPLHVEVQIARCNATDVFRKKLGREQALAAPVKLVHLRDLPRLFRDTWTDVQRRMRQQRQRWRAKNFDHLVRDWLPKRDVIYTPQEEPPVAQSRVVLTNDERLLEVI